MNDSTGIFVDQWLKECDRYAPLPDDLELVCEYELALQFDGTTETAYHRRTDSHAELWVDTECGRGRVFAAPLDDPGGASAEFLLGARFHGLVGYAWPEKLLKPGLVDKAAFRSIVTNLEKKLDRNARAARADRSAIIELAEELGLGPVPTGTGPDHWQARCLGRKHYLYISSSANSFGCGYCRIKGGLDELRELVRERRERMEVS